MNGAHLLTLTATITTRAEQADDDGNLVRDELGVVQTVETTRTVPCWHEQITSGEFPPISEETHNAWFPAGDPLGHADKVTVDGENFEVIGPPAQLTNPRTDELALVHAVLRKTTG